MKRHLIEDLRSRLKANQENEKTSNETLQSLERKVLFLAIDSFRKNKNWWICRSYLNMLY